MNLLDPRLHAGAWAVLVAGALLFTGPEMGPAGPWARWLESVGGDKAVHLGLFLVQSLLLVRVFAHPRPRHLVAAALLATLYGGLTEAVQAVHPGRTAELADFAADAVGAVLGALAAGLGRRTSC
ncbi:MAG: VanZ family protein [Acidobacteriota bacterium]